MLKIQIASGAGVGSCPTEAWQRKSGDSLSFQS